VATKHAFLSPEWVEAAREIYAQAAAESDAPPAPLRMNLVIEGVPFAAEGFAAHLDTSDGVAEVDVGHIDDADLTVTLGYEVAKAVLIRNDAQAGIEAFMTGQIRVDGDVTRLLVFQQATPSDRQLALTEQIRSITE
jgi:hypothetical protein